MSCLLILEDQQVSGEAMVTAFDNRGFEAEHVRNIEQTNIYIQTNRNKGPLVAILDMNLGNESVTGAEIGKRLLKAYPMNPPELIFYTAHHDLPYWQEAARMGAAMYLHKVEDGHHAVITHTRVLMLRHSTNDLNYKAFYIRDYSQSNSLLDICHDIIKATLLTLINEMLSLPCFLILSVNNQQIALTSDLDLQPKNSLYQSLLEELKILPFGTCCSEPFKTPAFPSELGGAIQDSVILPLYRSQDISLYLGLKKQDQQLGTILESTDKIVEAMCIHIKPTWLEPFFYQIRMAFQAENKQREDTLLTARFCHSIGKVQQEFYAAATKAGEVPTQPFHLAKIDTVAKGLEDVGKRLQLLVDHKTSLQPTPFSELAHKTWSGLIENHNFPRFTFICQPGIAVQANASDLSAALRRIFLWMLSRHDRYVPGVNREVQISASVTLGGVVIDIRDQSQRMPPEMLEDLFSPFTDAMDFDDGLDAWIGLFMSKILVEARLGGRLEERTATLPEQSHGHLLRLTLRPTVEDRKSN